MVSKYVGVDLGSHEVKVALVRGGLRSARLLETTSARVVGVEEGRDPLDAALDAAVSLLRERGWTDLPLGVALPGSATSFRVVKFPFSDPKRVAQVINFELEGQFPVPIDDLEFDHVVAPISGGGAAALVTAVRSDRLDEVVKRLRDANFDLRVVTSGPLAVAQVLGGGILPSVSGEDKTPVALLLDVGQRETSLVALADKGPVAARTLRRGGRDLTQALREAYGLAAADAEEAKHRDGFVLHAGLTGLSPEQVRSGEVLVRALERTVREIEHTRRWLDSELRCEVTELRLVGAGSLLSGLDAFLAERTDLPCRVFAGQANASVVGVPATSWATHAAAVGTALGTAKRPLAQLYDPISAQGDGGWLQERFGALATIGIAITAFAALDTIVKLNALEAERDRHETELASASEAVFGQALYSATDVEDRLASVEGADLTSMLPDRSALDVLAMIAKAVTPKAGSAPSSAGGPGAPPSSDGEADDDDDDDDETDSAVAPSSTELAPVPPDAGIVADDDLVISQIDIRELVVEMSLSATRATAQDRLKLKLISDLPCVTSVTPSKIRDQNQRKVFPMKIDHRCFRADKVEE